MITFSSSKHKLSDFINVRVRDYWVRGATPGVVGANQTTFSRVALLKNKSRTGSLAFGDGFVEFVMWNVVRKRGDKKLNKQINDGVDEAMLYAKELGEALGLPVVDERKHY